MALNPPISPTGVPLRVDQEYFVLYRNDMECEVKIQGMGKFTAKGKIYLTTCRIVFVNDKFSSESFKSFDFPLAYLHREKFQQPIFGSNYLEGDVDPLYNLLPGITHFKIWFKSGGCDRFLRLLVDILRQIRRHRQNGQMVPEPRQLEQFARTQSQAYMDPNDPSIIYVQQPQLNQQSYGNTTWGIPQNKVSPMEPPNYMQQPQPQNYQPPPQSNFQYPPMGVPIPENNNTYNQQNNNPYNQPYNPYNQQPQQQYQPPQQQYQPPPQQYQPPPQQYQPPPQQYQPPPQQYQPPPQQYQPPPQQYQPPPQQYQPPPQQYQPPPQQYQPPPQQYQPPPQQYQTPTQQPPPQQQYQPPPQEFQPPPQAPQQPPQQQNDQVRNQPTMAYYYGFWGPQLQPTQNAVL